MATISKEKAVELLTSEVERIGAHEVREIHADVFMEPPIGSTEAPKDVSPLVKRIVDYLHSGIDPEEMVDVWCIIFPHHHKVSYDEEEGMFHFSEESEPMYAEYQ